MTNTNGHGRRHGLVGLMLLLALALAGSAKAQELKGSSVSLTEHFTWDEVRCRHCGFIASAENAESLAVRLELVRFRYQATMPICSWTRCEEHNREIGGVRNSAHLRSLAADVLVPDDVQKFRLVRAYRACGFTRIGIYPTFVHGDIDGELPQVGWGSE